MFLVDLVKETLEFVEAQLYQLQTPSIRLQIYLNTQPNVRYVKIINTAQYFKNTVIRDMICAIFEVYIHFSVEKRKDIFSLKEQIH